MHPETQNCHFLDELPKQDPRSFSTYKVGEHQTTYILVILRLKIKMKPYMCNHLINPKIQTTTNYYFGKMQSAEVRWG